MMKKVETKVEDRLLPEPPEDIFVERNGEQIPYSDLAKEVESS